MLDDVESKQTRKWRSTYPSVGLTCRTPGLSGLASSRINYTDTDAQQCWLTGDSRHTGDDCFGTKRESACSKQLGLPIWHGFERRSRVGREAATYADDRHGLPAQQHSAHDSSLHLRRIWRCLPGLTVAHRESLVGLQSVVGEAWCDSRKAARLCGNTISAGAVLACRSF